MELFKLFGTIAVKNTEANNAIDETSNKAASFSEKLSDGFTAVGSKAASLGTRMSIGLTGPITLLGTKAIQVTADFESAMSEVGAISGATGDDFIALKNKAEEMGKTTKFSATESAEALKYMAMAGWETSDMLDGLEGIMNLAAASGESLGTTSDIVTDALTAFGMKAKDSGRFADVLAQASSSANTNVGEMGEAFKYVAPVAGTLGYSIEDVSMAIGLMSNGSVHASQAGTVLRGSLSRLVKPTKEMISTMVGLGLATEETTNVIDNGKLQKAQTKVENKTIDMEKAQIKYNDAVAKYGVNSSQAETAALNLEKAQNNLEAAIYDLNTAQEGKIKTTGIDNKLLIDSQGNTKSLREVMLTLRSTFSGLSQEQQAQAATTLFGQEAMAGMLNIINASEEDFNRLAEAIDNSDGRAQEMSDTMNDNLSGQIVLLKSQLEALAIQFVTLIMPYLRQAVEWLSKVCDWISGLDDGTKKMIITVAAVLAAAGPVLIFIGKVATGIGSIIRVGGGLIGGIGKISGGISGIIGIGGKLISGIGGLVVKIASVLVPAIGSIAGPVLAVITVLGALVLAGVAVYKNWDEIREWAGSIWEKIKEIVGGAVDKIRGFFLGIVDFVKNNWQGLTMFLVNPFAGGFKLVYDNCESFRNFIDSFLGKIREGLHNFTSKIIEKAGEFGKNFIEVGANIITGLWEGITSACTWLFDKVKNIFSKIIDVVKNLFGIHSPSTVFMEIGKNIIEGLVEGLRRFLQSIINVVSNIVNLIVDGFNKLKNSIIEKIDEIKENVVHKFHQLKDGAMGKIRSLKEDAINKFNELKDGSIEKFNELKDKATEKIENLKENAAEKFTQLKENAVEKVNSLKENAVQKFNELKDHAVERVEKLKDSAVDKFNQLKDRGTEKVNALKESAVSKFNEMKDKASEKINALKDKGVAGFEALRAKGIEKFDGLRSGISEKLEAVKSFVSGTVDKLKSFFDFDWKLPHIKLPHFNISGSFSLDPPSIPHIGVDWYKKAMNRPVIMDKPTAFGINPAGQIMAGGEAGSEVVSGTETLMGMISAAVSENNSQLYELLDKLYVMLSEYLPMLANMQMVLDSGALVGELAQPLNEELGKIIYMRRRHN